MQENNINHDFAADLKSINSFLLHKKRPNSPIVITIMQSHEPGNRAHGVLWEFQCVKHKKQTQGYRSKLANRRCIWLIFIFFICDFQEKKRKERKLQRTLCIIVVRQSPHSLRPPLKTNHLIKDISWYSLHHIRYYTLGGKLNCKGWRCAAGGNTQISVNLRFWRCRLFSLPLRID